MRLLRKDTADSYLKGDLVYYLENGELKRSKYISAKDHSILTEDGEFAYDEVGKTWFLTELVAKQKQRMDDLFKNEKLKVCWISAGVSSFISGYLERDTIDKFIYIDIDDQHPDSMRFIKDCEKVLDKKIEILKSPYGSVENAIRAAGIIRNARNGFYVCTNWLKKRIRKEWEYDHRNYDITYVWGFDCDEKQRAENLLESMPEFSHCFPMIERNISKQEAHGMCERLGLKRPAMYELGYNNNNCIGCVKGGMGYWNKIRVDFPDVFESRSKLEREIGSSILKECYLDELDPNRGRMSDEILTDCNIFCMLNI